MYRFILIVVAFFVCRIAFAQEDVASESENVSAKTAAADWVGDWVTDRGLMSLTRSGDQLTGTLDTKVAFEPNGATS